MLLGVDVVVCPVGLRPIARLAAAAERISTGRPIDRDLAVPGEDEISALARTLRAWRAGAWTLQRTSWPPRPGRPDKPRIDVRPDAARIGPLIQA